MTYTPPLVGSPATLTVAVQVTDGRGGTATGSVPIYVTPRTVSNIAGSASVAVSSENTSTGQLGIKAIDGVIAGSPGDYKREWATVGQLAGAWITLTWSAPQTISSVILYDRPNLTDNVTSGTLLFSDGSSVAVGALPNNGAAYNVLFPSRTVTWVKFRVDTAVGLNIGLAEFQVYPPAYTTTAVTEQQTVVPGTGLDLRMRSANPIADRARFELTLHEAGHVQVAVFDVQGRTVAVLEDALMPAGSMTVTWNPTGAGGGRAGQGVYYLQARFNGRAVRTQRIVVLR